MLTISLTVSDLTPNVGMWWYFFTEMFEHFRSFFLGVFQVRNQCGTRLIQAASQCHLRCPAVPSFGASHRHPRPCWRLLNMEKLSNAG